MAAQCLVQSLKMSGELMSLYLFFLIGVPRQCDIVVTFRNMDIFGHAQIVILDHSFIIGHTSCCRVSIVSNLLTPHATMNFYIILVFYI